MVATSASAACHSFANELASKLISLGVLFFSKQTPQGFIRRFSLVIFTNKEPGYPKAKAKAYIHHRHAHRESKSLPSTSKRNTSFESNARPKRSRGPILSIVPDKD
jgi:hypothetical protein